MLQYYGTITGIWILVLNIRIPYGTQLKLLSCRTYFYISEKKLYMKFYTKRHSNL
jgi:hypothetical protein